MHDSKIINKILDEAKKLGKISILKLDVGELSSFDPTHLKEHLQEYVPWEIKTTVSRSKIKCSCGFMGSPKIIEREHDFVLFQCPKCKNKKPEILEGDKISITGYE